MFHPLAASCFHNGLCHVYPAKLPSHMCQAKYHNLLLYDDHIHSNHHLPLILHQYLNERKTMSAYDQKNRFQLDCSLSCSIQIQMDTDLGFVCLSIDFGNPSCIMIPPLQTVPGSSLHGRSVVLPRQNTQYPDGSLKALPWNKK